MATDDFSLFVDNRKISDVLSYTVDSDLYVAADAFNIEIAGSNNFIPVGVKAVLHINGTVAMTGVIDKVTYSCSKSSETTSISGRDLMGLLCDHYCEEFGDKQSLGSLTVKKLAETLLKDVPFISRSNVVYADGANIIDSVYKSNYIPPGSTIFDVLKEYAAGRGLLFYAMPNGTFVIGKPKEFGAASFFLQRKRINGQANNILEGGATCDISGSYSKVTITGQRQGEAKDGSPEQINVKGTVALSTGDQGDFPYYKPYIATSNKDEVSPILEAKRFMNASRAKMLLLEYITPGHNQNGRNWAANELAHVVDECSFGPHGSSINGTYLIYSRTFEMQSKESGPVTRLKLGMPGAILGD
jgi:prophage tail gpP-like protein